MTTVRGRVVTPQGVLDDAFVRLAADRIEDVAPVAGRERADLRAAWVVPGFIDVHVHGGGGHTFTTGEADEAQAAIAFHRQHGTTTMLASLVTAARRETLDAVTGLTPLVHSGELAGLHLEGPYLSTARCGAQNPAYLRDPDPDELADLIGSGVVRVVTMAPELPGALPAFEELREHGVTVAVGHTDATYEQTTKAVSAGATLATHLCNGMRPIHHRDPGAVIALLESPSIVCEVVADGVHLHDAMLRHIVAVAGADRVALVTDAMAAAGMPDGEYSLGGLDVSVSGGVARLAASGTIAGSTLTMAAAFQRTVHSGISIVDAVQMAATTPAHVLGLEGDRGVIAPGMRADLVLLDDDLHVTTVIRAGEPVPNAQPVTVE
jgi:N-acetylglucosamine-6-phosphate deacetylase